MPARYRQRRFAHHLIGAALPAHGSPGCPDYLDEMMKVEQRMEANVAALLGPIKDAANRAAPACYAGQERSSLSRFRNNPDGNCIAIVRPNWLLNPALPRSAPQVLVIAHFERCLTSDQPALHAGGCSANRKLLETIAR